MTEKAKPAQYEVIAPPKKGDGAWVILAGPMSKNAAQRRAAKLRGRNPGAVAVRRGEDV